MTVRVPVPSAVTVRVAVASRAAAEPDDGSVPEFVTESVHAIWPGEAGRLETRQLDSVLVTRFCRGPQLQRCQPQTLPDNTPTGQSVTHTSTGEASKVRTMCQTSDIMRTGPTATEW